jgi:hypothetical protein
MLRPCLSPSRAKKCACGLFAVTARKIRRYRSQGRLTSEQASYLLPRADRRPPEQLCVHHMIRYLARLFGPTIRKQFWGDRLRQRHPPRWRIGRPCLGRRRNGAACRRLAKRGSDYCHAHEPQARQLWSLRPNQMGVQCKAKAVRTGKRCQNRAMRSLGLAVCWFHGGKQVLARRAIAARPYDPVAAAARKEKQARHRAMQALRRAGKLPPPQKESPQRMERRWAREQAVEHRIDVMQGRAMSDMEREFRGEHEQQRPLKPLYGI